MATMTAQILIGTAHPYDGGINPSHYLYLSENSRPALILVNENIFEDNKKTKKIVWIPTLDHMLEDALVMIGLHIIRDPELVQMAKPFKLKAKKWVEMYDDLDQDTLMKMYARAREMENVLKITLSVFEGSTFLSQLSVLDSYSMDVELCMPTFTRQRSWTGKINTNGSLEVKQNIKDQEV